MTDQGWMVDDGTCGPCLHGLCYRCDDPRESYGDGEIDPRVELLCCCHEDYHIGYAHLPDEEAEP